LAIFFVTIEEAMDIPFHKPYITKDEIDEVVDTLKKGWLTMGPKTIEFEEKFGIFVNSKYAVSLNSCTAALHLALGAIGIKPGDEVIIPSITFTATAEVVCYFGAKPVIVDVEPETFTISVKEIEKAITKKTIAIIPVHYGGHPADLDGIKQLAQKYRLKVIEDAAHSLPAYYKGVIIGSHSDAVAFSFYATKTLATGEGGMLTTNNEEIAEKSKVMRLHGISKDAWKRYQKGGSWEYNVVGAGFKYNTTDINSSLGLKQLEKVELMWQMRKNIANRYRQNLKDCSCVFLPVEKECCRSAWHLFPLRFNNKKLSVSRDRIIELLNNFGIGTSVHFIPLYRFSFYKDLLKPELNKFKVSEMFFKQVISLPIFPGMTKKEIDYICDKVLEICKKYEK
jgi:perosamine synthetase